MVLYLLRTVKAMQIHGSVRCVRLEAPLHRHLITASVIRKHKEPLLYIALVDVIQRLIYTAQT